MLVAMTVVVGVPVAMLFFVPGIPGGNGANPAAIGAGAVLLILLLIPIVLVLGLIAYAIQTLMSDFVIPVMTIEGLGGRAGFKRAWSIVKPEKGSYCFYLFMRFVLAIAAAISSS